MHQILHNSVVQTLSWTGVNVSVSNRGSKETTKIVKNVHGEVHAGEILAIVGPSGSGKTTLLNVLAHRSLQSAVRISSQTLLNGEPATRAHFRTLSRFVESEDALVGALTVRETLYFAAELGVGARATKAERAELIDEMLSMFGLVEQANTIVGTLIRKGISTGQKRRLSVASQLISAPRILFLDEPTSGLDSAASFRVMSHLKKFTKAHNLLVVCSIHQPSSNTLAQFDKTLILSQGKTCFMGKVDDLRPYFHEIGFSIPSSTNPIEFVLDLINADFEPDGKSTVAAITSIHESWQAVEAEGEADGSQSGACDRQTQASFSIPDVESLHYMSYDVFLRSTLIVMHRDWIKSRRDALVYAARLAMYLGLAVLVGTVWLRLPANESSIDPLARCILFGSTFMSFMAVVYVPAFIEDHRVFVKDRDNGLYNSMAFLTSNFLLGLPYLFILAAVPSIFAYWMVNFRPDGSAFIIWILWAYLNLLAAESLVVLVSSLLPDFVGALAAFAMMNSILMACNGFMVPRAQLNVFYRYLFYYINYQAYVYRGLSQNEFGSRSYDCGSDCQCHMPLSSTTSTSSGCEVDGLQVLQYLGLGLENQGMLIGIMISIIMGTRVLALAVLAWR